MRSDYNVYSEALTQIELADSTGFDYVAAVEHHFIGGIPHSSASVVFFGDGSQRTKRVQLSHGARQLPFNFNHPFKVAEK
jgi:alkanesulfonate monooxygenase SsuD/methylene tetrahydromethanopterin reductase-like flavin-dependent oxidoreductase (luciferase family)